MKSVITKLEINDDASTHSVKMYDLDIKDKPRHGVTVKRIFDVWTGKTVVKISSIVKDGAPVLSLSTMDAVARRIIPNARVENVVKGSKITIREYAAN